MDRQKVTVFANVGGVRRCGGQAFFDGANNTVRFCRWGLDFMTATSVSRRPAGTKASFSLRIKEQRPFLLIAARKRLVKDAEPTNCDCPQVHRLCVCASGSLMILLLC